MRPPHVTLSAHILCWTWVAFVAGALFMLGVPHWWNPGWDATIQSFPHRP